jgi:hypothetical protein
MIDWTVVADLATAVGTALLAVSTFSATRSANAAARSAEHSFLEGLRPVLVPSRWSDPTQKVHFIDGRWVAVQGGRAAMEVTEQAIYLVLSVRNAGQGIAVLDGWDLPAEWGDEPRAWRSYHRQTRDVYVPTGDSGFFQIAERDPAGEHFTYLAERAADRRAFWIDLFYGDAEGSQRVITRMALSPSPADGAEESEWAVSAARHWNLDRPDPR